jgi:hypothetical protein
MFQPERAQIEVRKRPYARRELSDGNSVLRLGGRSSQIWRFFSVAADLKEIAGGCAKYTLLVFRRNFLHEDVAEILSQKLALSVLHRGQQLDL